MTLIVTDNGQLHGSIKRIYPFEYVIERTGCFFLHFDSVGNEKNQFPYTMLDDLKDRGFRLIVLKNHIQICAS